MTTTPERIGNTDTNTETDAAHHGGTKSVAVGPVIPRCVMRPPPGTIDNSRIVGRHIDDLRICRLNNNDRLAGRRLFHNHLLLLCGLEIAFILCLLAQLLHRIHNRFRIGQKGITHILYPVRLFTRHGQHLWKGDQRHDAGIPGLVLHGVHCGITVLVRIIL